jgi:hypothetical protein
VFCRGFLIGVKVLFLIYYVCECMCVCIEVPYPVSNKIDITCYKKKK